MLNGQCKPDARKRQGRARKSPTVYTGSRQTESAFTLLELLVALAIIGMLASVLLPALARAREAARRASCQNNLKQFSVAFKMYASEAKGAYPPPAPYTSVRADARSSPLFEAPHAAAIFPEYLTDLGISRCPSDPGGDPQWASVLQRLPSDGDFEAWKREAADAHDKTSLDYYQCAELARSYLYKGYVSTNVGEFYGIWGAKAVNPYLGDVTILNVGQVRYKDYRDDLLLDLSIWPPWVPAPPAATGTAGTNMVRRLKEGIERFFITDINDPARASLAESEVPVMWDTYGSGEFTDSGDAQIVFNHLPGGSNVLYMDGHVEFSHYPSAYPITNDSQVLKENSHHGLL